MQRTIFLVFLVIFSLILSSCIDKSTNEPINQSEQVQIEELPKITTTTVVSTEAEKVFSYPKIVDDMQNSEQYRHLFETITLKNIDAKRACEILSKVIPEALFLEGVKSNQLIVKAMPIELPRIKNLVANIDLPVKQIMIESQVIEISESSLENLGVSWTLSRNGIKMAVESSSLKADNIYAVISALKSSGQARLLANPRIATMDNQEANVAIGSKIPFAVPVNTSTTTQWTVQYIDAGVSLKITPRLADGDYLIVNVNPEVSSISEWRTTAAGEFPVISTRNANTRLKIKNGQTIIIGGLINETDRINISKVPFAGDIPIIGELFTQKIKENGSSEIIFLIKPKVI